MENILKMQEVELAEICRNNCGLASEEECYGLCSNCYKEAVKDIQKDTSMDDLLSIDTEEIFDWNDSRLDEALVRLNIEAETAWSKSKKTYEVMNVIKEKNATTNKSNDKDALMLEVLN